MDQSILIGFIDFISATQIYVNMFIFIALCLPFNPITVILAEGSK